MAKNAGFLMCLLIMAIDLVAGILGIEAQIAQNKVKHLKAGPGVRRCGGPSHQAFKLGLVACVLLALAHAIGNSIWRCVCVCSKKDLERKTANKLLAGASLIFSWINMAAAFTLLVAGTVSNSKSRRSCWLGHHQPLLIGGLLCFTHGIFMVAYIESAKATRKEDRRELLQRHAEHGQP